LEVEVGVQVGSKKRKIEIVNGSDESVPAQDKVGFTSRFKKIR